MVSLPAVIASEPEPRLSPTQAGDDAQMVRLWLARSSSSNTRRNYEREARRFLAHIGKPLGSVRMGELQDYIVGLPGSDEPISFAIDDLSGFALKM